MKTLIHAKVCDAELYGQDIEVRIEPKEGYFASSNDTKIFCNGKDISGQVSRVKLQVRANQAAMLTLELIPK